MGGATSNGGKRPRAWASRRRRKKKKGNLCVAIVMDPRALTKDVKVDNKIINKLFLEELFYFAPNIFLQSRKIMAFGLFFMALL